MDIVEMGCLGYNYKVWFLPRTRVHYIDCLVHPEHQPHISGGILGAGEVIHVQSNSMYDKK